MTTTVSGPQKSQLLSPEEGHTAVMNGKILFGTTLAARGIALISSTNTFWGLVSSNFLLMGGHDRSRRVVFVGKVIQGALVVSVVAQKAYTIGSFFLGFFSSDEEL